MRRSALLVVCLAVFVDMLGFGIIIPLLPFQAKLLGGSGVWVGALLTAYSAAQLIGAPILGALSDRYGRRRLLLLSLAGSVVSLAVTGFAGSLWALLGARLIAGMFGGSIAVAQAYVVDLVPAAQRTRALGMVGASIGMGFVFGPGIGGLLAGYGFATASLVAAGIALANLLAGLVLLPRPVAAVAGSGPLLREASALRPVRAALHRPELRSVLGALFVAMFALASMESTFALLGAARYGLTGRRFGLLFSLIGITMALVQGGIVGRMAERFGDRRVALFGMLLSGAALLAIPFGSAWTAYACLGLVAVGQGLLSPTLSVLIAGRGGRELGGVFGVGQAVSAMARGVGPLVAGLAYDLRPSSPYVLGATLSVLGAVLLSARVQDRSVEAGAARLAAAQSSREPVSAGQSSREPVPAGQPAREPVSAGQPPRAPVRPWPTSIMPPARKK